MNGVDLTRVTDENLDDLMDAARYGVTYWATDPTDRELEAIAHDESVEWLIVEEEGHLEDGRVIWPVTRSMLREAYGQLAALDQKHVGSLIHGYFIDSYRDWNEKDGIDTCHIDASAADCLVQVACFGEVIYG